jgi:hypothetical protein
LLQNIIIKVSQGLKMSQAVEAFNKLNSGAIKVAPMAELIQTAVNGFVKDNVASSQEEEESSSSGEEESGEEMVAPVVAAVKKKGGRKPSATSPVKTVSDYSSRPACKLLYSRYLDFNEGSNAVKFIGMSEEDMKRELVQYAEHEKSILELVKKWEVEDMERAKKYNESRRTVSTKVFVEKINAVYNSVLLKIEKPGLLFILQGLSQN